MNERKVQSYDSSNQAEPVVIPVGASQQEFERWILMLLTALFSAAAAFQHLFLS